MQRTMLTSEQRTELDAVMRTRHGNAALARRARCVLLWAAGERRVDVRAKLACNDAFVTRWTSAYDAQGLAGLVSLHPGRAPKRPVAKLEARVLERTLKHLPKDGSTHWSSRKLAAELGDVSFSAVQRIWRKHGVRPHRLDTHMVSNDPDFETKAADVIGLYLNPPAHAAVFCVDEKTAIQALDRKDRMLPLSPGRAESHGFEYKRNGTPQPVRSSEHRHRRSAGQDRTAPHQRAVRCLLGRDRRQPDAAPPDPCHLRQRQQPQDRTR
jgi:transposase